MVVMQPDDEKKNPLSYLNILKLKSVDWFVSETVAKLKPGICTPDLLTVPSVEIMLKRVPVKRQ